MKKVLAMLMAALIILTMFAACGNGDTTGADSDAADKGSSASDNKDTDSDTEVFGDYGYECSYDKLPEGFKAEKIGKIDASIYTYSEHSSVYKSEEGKFGIVDSVSGEKYTEAIYTDAESLGDYYYKVTTSELEKAVDNLESLNCYGVLNNGGAEVVPQKYAVIKKLSDKYVQVFEATEQTTNKDEAVIYLTRNIFSQIAPGDDDIFFKGRWYIYDVEEGKLLDGISATNAYNVNARGDIIDYVSDAEEKVCVNAANEAIPEDANIFSNGCYVFKENDVSAVYDAYGKKLFDCEKDGFVPKRSEGEYFSATKYVDGKYSYAIMNEKGEVVSAEFTASPYVYGDLIHDGKQLYDFDGNLIIEGEYQYVHFDEYTENLWVLRNGKEFTYITKDGTVLYEGTEDDTLLFDYLTNFSIYKKVNNDITYYCFADKDFTLSGASLAPYLISVEAENNLCELVDTLSGKTVLEGYSRYSAVTIDGSGIYVHAYNSDGTIDVYIVR